MRVVQLTGFLAALMASPAWGQTVDAEAIQPESTDAIRENTSVTASEFMVAAAHPMATKAGYAVLEAGGTAADAAVAVQLMLNLVEPQSSGIGGGAFAVWRDGASGEVFTYDGRERAPLSATPDYWLKPDGEPMGWRDAVPGGRSVGVPGTLKLLETMHGAHGSVAWADLITPVTETAEKGFEVSPRLSASIAGRAEELATFPIAASYFLDGEGKALAEGTLLKNPNFARTLRLISLMGADAMYDGPLGQAIIEQVTVQTNRGELTQEDFDAYTVVKRPAVCVDYRAHEVCGMGPPSSGALTVGQILGLLNHFDLPSMAPGSGREGEAAHLFAEAAKLAYADRAMYMADSDHVSVPVAGLLDPAYLTARAQLINPDAASPVQSAGNPPWREAALRAPDTQAERPGTSHFVIVDGQGNMLSMTTTIESGFGSRVMTNGFLLNNELTDFSFRAADGTGRPIANRVEAGKRPRSSMAPTIVLRDGEPVLLIGSPGGSRIITYVAQGIIGILDWGMDPQDALDLGHVVNRNGDTTELETGSDAEALSASLEARGHKINVRDLNSGLHAILIDPETGAMTGGADKRREGAVMGR